MLRQLYFSTGPVGFQSNNIPFKEGMFTSIGKSPTPFKFKSPLCLLWLVDFLSVLPRCHPMWYPLFAMRWQPPTKTSTALTLKTALTEVHGSSESILLFVLCFWSSAHVHPDLLLLIQYVQCLVLQLLLSHAGFLFVSQSLDITKRMTLGLESKMLQFWLQLKQRWTRFYSTV